MLGKIEGRRRWGRQAIRWLDASLTQWTWAWASSRSRCHKVIRHDWVTELNWEVLPWYQIGCKFWELLAYTSFCEWSECVCVLVMLGRTTLELRSSYYLFQLKHGMFELVQSLWKSGFLTWFKKTVYHQLLKLDKLSLFDLPILVP